MAGWEDEAAIKQKSNYCTWTETLSKPATLLKHKLLTTLKTGWKISGVAFYSSVTKITRKSENGCDQILKKSGPQTNQIFLFVTKERLWEADSG